MTIPGRVHDGVVVLEGDITLPEGTEVSIVSRATPTLHVSKHQKRIQLPLVRSSNPGSLHLTNEMIAEILNDEDMPT
jgi:hypothetical protein